MLTLTQLILFGLLATCATGFFVEEPSAVKQIKWTPGSAGQPKWTLDVQLKYSFIGTEYQPVLLSPFTFDVDGKLMNMTVRFARTKAANWDYKYFEVSFLVHPKRGRFPYFTTNGTITLQNHKGLPNLVKPYNCVFDVVTQCPYNVPGHTLRGFLFEKEDVLRKSRNGWIKGGNVNLSITFDYYRLPDLRLHF